MYEYKGKVIVVSQLVRKLRQMGVQRGVSVSNLSRILSGDINPSLGMSKNLADAMGVSLDEMYEILKATAESARRRKEALAEMMEDEEVTVTQLLRNLPKLKLKEAATKGKREK